MLSLLAMLKLVTLKGCCHDMQRNAEQRVKYYRNKRHRPTFKPVLSGLPTHDSIKEWTVSTAQAIRLHGVYKDGPRLHPLHQKLNRLHQQTTEMPKPDVREIFELCDSIAFLSVYICKLYCLFALDVDSLSSVGI